MFELIKRAYGKIQPQDMARRQLHETRVALLDAEMSLESARCLVSLLAERESRLAAFVQAHNEDAQLCYRPTVVME